MRSISFLVDDQSRGDGNALVTIMENGDGTLSITVVALGCTDLRGIFFDVADESLIGSLSVSETSAGFTEFRQGNDAVSNLGDGADMLRLLGTERAVPTVSGSEGNGYDAGVEVGNSTSEYEVFSFTLSASRDLTLDDFANTDFGIRLGDGTKLLERTAVAINTIDDSAALTEDVAPGATSGNVLANDLNKGLLHAVVEVNGDWRNLGCEIQGDYGTLRLDIFGRYTYTLDNARVQHLGVGDQAIDHFSYTAKRVNDLTTFSHDTASLDIVISGSNDGPTAVADVASVGENETKAIDVLANDTDPDGDALTLLSVSGPASVVANKVLFDPGTAFDHLAAGASAVLTLDYTMEDEHHAVSGATLTLTVEGVNDGPVAVNDTASGHENETVSVDVLANDTDADDGHVFTLTTVAAGSIVGNQLVFDPGSAFDHLAQGATASIDIGYTMQDEHGAASSAVASITLTGLNDGPLAQDDEASVGENGTVSVDVLSNDTDVDDAHVFTLTGTSDTRASIVGNQLFFDAGTGFDHLAADASELVNIDYTMQDEHGAPSGARLVLTVEGVNDSPLATSDSAFVNEDDTVTINVLGNDDDVDQGHVFTLTATTDPRASIVGNQIVYDAGDFDHLAAGALESVQFIYAMQDEHGSGSSAIVSLIIDGLNDGPVAVDDTASANENDTLTIDVLANDTDADDGHVLTVTATGDSRASIVANQLLFKPGTDFDHLAQGASEDLKVGYTMQDEHGASANAVATITFTGLNDGPVAVDDKATTEENTSITIDVLANDTDADDGHSLTLTAAAAPAGKGTASIVGNKVLFNPGNAFDHLGKGASEVVTLQYTVQDEHSASDSGSVALTITGSADGLPVLSSTQGPLEYYIDFGGPGHIFRLEGFELAWPQEDLQQTLAAVVGPTHIQGPGEVVLSMGSAGQIVELTRDALDGNHLSEVRILAFQQGGEVDVRVDDYKFSNVFVTDVDTLADADSTFNAVTLRFNALEYRPQDGNTQSPRDLGEQFAIDTHLDYYVRVDGVEGWVALEQFSMDVGRPAPVLGGGGGSSGQPFGDAALTFGSHDEFGRWVEAFAQKDVVPEVEVEAYGFVSGVGRSLIDEFFFDGVKIGDLHSVGSTDNRVSFDFEAFSHGHVATDRTGKETVTTFAWNIELDKPATAPFPESGIDFTL